MPDPGLRPSRRDFLTGRFHPAKGKGTHGNGAPAADPVMIGRIGDHPVGGTVRIPGRGIEIESLPEGLRARLTGGGSRCAAIRSGMAGHLFADPAEPWPEDMVYSMLINGPIRLETGHEEES